MFLAVCFGTAFEKVFTFEKSFCGVAEDKFLWRDDQVAIRRRNAWISHGNERFDVGHDLLCSLSRKLFARRNNDRDRLPVKMDLASSKQRFVGNNSTDLVFADDVFGSNNANDAFACFSLF